MGITFRLSGMRPYHKNAVSMNYFAFNQFRRALAEAIGFHEWVTWYDHAMKNIFNKSEDIPSPPNCPWGNWAEGFDALCNGSDAEGKIKVPQLISLSYLLKGVTCIRPFTGDESNLTKYEANHFNVIRRDLYYLTKLAIDKRKNILWG